MLVTRFPYSLAGNYIGDISTAVSIQKGKDSDTYYENSFGVRHPLPDTYISNKLKLAPSDYQKLVDKCKQSLAKRALDTYHDPVDDIAIYNVRFSLTSFSDPHHPNYARYYLAGGGTVVDAISN